MYQITTLHPLNAHVIYYISVKLEVQERERERERERETSKPPHESKPAQREKKFLLVEEQILFTQNHSQSNHSYKFSINTFG